VRGELLWEENPGGGFLLLWAVVLVLSSGDSTLAASACGAAISVTTPEGVTEEYALRQGEQTIRAGRARVQAGDAVLRSRLAHSPTDFDQSLAQQLAVLRRTEVEPKRHTLEHLRAQHEDARHQWDRGRHLLSPQLAAAQASFHAKTITPDAYCRIRETYKHAVRFYWRGIQSYRHGLELYAHALDLYDEQFLTPYLHGFTDRHQWQQLIAHLTHGDFLHEVLVPLTVNAVRSVPPDLPPD